LQTGSGVGNNRSVAACPACGFEYEGNFKFCPECASPLAGAPAVSERKVVTSLFCDLVGFTAASESADPEDVDRVLAGYFRMARAQIEGHGGVVEKFIGDAVVGVFGVPAAREDDPERAVRAALRICEGATELRGLRRGPLELRVGVNTGIVLVRLGASPASGEGFVTGDSVNTAARLQSAAPVGGVAVGLATWEATSRVFDYEELEPAALKGKAEPVRVFRPLAPRARMGVDLTRTHDSPFVGRRSELEALTGAFDRAVAGRSVELVTVVGEPGLGKSRLIGELSDYVDRSQDLFSWRQGRCLPYGEGIAFWALGEIVKAHAGILESDPPELAREKLEAVLPEGEERPWFRERLLPLLGIEPGSSAGREESFTAWLRFIEQVAADRPTVLVFEDLHWAGEGMLAFLDHLAANISAVPLLVVSTTRPELYDRYPDQGAGLPTVRLAPLSEAESGQLVAGLLDSALLPAELQQAVRDRAGGNPLFTQEFLALLRDRDLIVQKGASWELRAGGEVPLPDSVQAAIAARLDTLEPDTKSLLGDAAVIGKVFWAGAVASMGDRDPAAAAATLGELVRRELVAPARRSSMAGEAEYAFGHALVCDVAYEQLPRSVRASRHLAAATWIEAKVADRVGDFADVLAHHYATALELSVAADDVEQAAALEAPAIRFLTLAGERALGLDSTSALASFERALALTPPGHPARAAVLAGVGEAALEADREAEAIASLEEAIAAYRDSGDPRAAARAAVVLSEVFVLRRNPRRKGMLNEMLALLEPLPPGPEHVAVLTELSGDHNLSGEPQAGLEVADRALALAAELGIGRPARTLGYRAANRRALGDPGAEDDFRDALDIALAAGQVRHASTIYTNWAGHRMMFESVAQGLEILDEGIALCRARGLTARVTFMNQQRVSMLFALGELDQVLEAVEGLVEQEGWEHNDRVLRAVFWYEVNVLLLRGQAHRLAALPDELEAWVDGETSRPAKGTRIALAARIRAALGQREAAVALLMAAADEGLSEGTVVGLAVELGEPELAERLSARWKDGPFRRFYGPLIAEARGDLETAAGAYPQLVDNFRSIGSVVELAEVLVGQGRVLARLGRTSEAAEALNQARPILVKLGAVPMLAETDALLQQLTALSA
jgi:class 3 adenylate cyclase/tetratricopeptide (TPR) repeat protein